MAEGLVEFVNSVKTQKILGADSSSLNSLSFHLATHNKLCRRRLFWAGTVHATENNVARASGSNQRCIIHYSINCTAKSNLTN